MIIEFADNQGRLGKVRGSAILAVLRSTAFIDNKVHASGGYFPAILLLEGGHRVETNTDFEAIVRAWRS
jgi:hypothetical protein